MKSSLLEQAIMELNARQMAAEGTSHISDIDPRALLVVTLGYLIAMLSVPVHSMGMLIWFAVYPIVTAPLAHIAYEKMFVKSLYVLPLIAVIGIFNPFFDTRTAFKVGTVAVSMGWVSFFSIIIRGLLSVQALLLLIYVCGFNSMCSAMSRIGVPGVLTTQLLMLYRYIGVLLQEALSMQRARIARGWGRTSFGPSMWGAFVGQLLLRAIERARRVNMCMKARGFNGSLPTADNEKWHTADTVYCLVWIPVFIALRFVDLSCIFSPFFNS